MNKEQIFSSKFMHPLIECYGQQKFPSVRIKALWEKMKTLPEHLYSQCADKIILNFDLFPGVQKIMDTCAEVSNQYAYLQAEELKQKVKCFLCRSQGVVLRNNYAYKCTCALGELLYPAFPLYAGQAQFNEEIRKEENGDTVFEDGNYISMRPAGAKSIREVRTIIKQPIDKKKVVEISDFKVMNFEGLNPEGA